MCEVRLEKIVSSKPGNWVRCTLAKLVISSHFEPSYLIIHTEILFSYHEISNGWADQSEHPSWWLGWTGRREEGRGNYKMIACSSDSNTSSKVSSVQVCVRRKLENNHRSICRVVHATRNPIVNPPVSSQHSRDRPRQRVERIVLTLSQSSHH